MIDAYEDMAFSANSKPKKETILMIRIWAELIQVFFSIRHLHTRIVSVSDSDPYYIQFKQVLESLD